MIGSDTGESRLLTLGEIPPIRKGHVPDGATHGVRSEPQTIQHFGEARRGHGQRNVPVPWGGTEGTTSLTTKVTNPRL